MKIEMDGETVVIRVEAATINVANALGDHRIAELEIEVARLKDQAERVWNRADRMTKADDEWTVEKDKLAEDNRILASEMITLRSTNESLRKQVLTGSELINRVRELEEHNTRLTRQLSDAIKERTFVLARNRNLRTEVERLESVRDHHTRTHRESLAARDRLLSQARSRVSHARIALTTDSVQRAADSPVTSNTAVLADAIGNALAALEA